MSRLLNNIRKLVSRRSAFLRWPVDSMRERVAATCNDTVVNRKAATTAYPIRAARYWWALCALRDELRGRKKPLVIADIGCGRGNTRRFVGDMPRTTWIGIDWSANHAILTQCGYDHVHS